MHFCASLLHIPRTADSPTWPAVRYCLPSRARHDEGKRRPVTRAICVFCAVPLLEYRTRYSSRRLLRRPEPTEACLWDSRAAETRTETLLPPIYAVQMREMEFCAIIPPCGECNLIVIVSVQIEKYAGVRVTIKKRRIRTIPLLYLASQHSDGNPVNLYRELFLSFYITCRSYYLVSFVTHMSAMLCAI